MAKAPVPGKVKTRLVPFLGEEGAARLQEMMILDLLETLARVKAQVVIACDPDTGHPFFEGLSRDFGFMMILQEGRDLGERLVSLFDFLLQDNAQALVMGTDSPHLSQKMIEEAFFLLSSADVVLGPSFDGGYYLVGLKRPMPHLFEEIPWSTERTLPETLRRASEFCLSVHLLSSTFDVDTPESLRLFLRHANLLAGRGLPVPRRSLALLRGMLG